MVTLSWLTVALGATRFVTGAAAFRPPIGTTGRVVDFCPERCSIAGPHTENWFVYPDHKSIKRCRETVFYSFSLHDDIDNTEINHRIRACSSYGSDFSNLPPAEPVAATLDQSATSVGVEFELGWWREGFGLAQAAIRSLLGQIRDYIDKGYGATDRPFVLYGQSGQASVGIYIGQGLLNQALSSSALQIFQDNFDKVGVTTPSLAMQLCSPDHSSSHIFGVAVTSNAAFAPIQDAIKSWANGTCLLFLGSKYFPGTARFTTPLLNYTSATFNSTTSANSSTLTNSTISAWHEKRAKSLRVRADCRSIQVESGNGCPELAIRCGISGADFDKYNPAICGSLKPKQHVCCSSGSLPDLRPKPNEDGSCFSYTTQDGDDCSSLEAEYGLTNKELIDFNKNTWGFSGCNPLFGQVVLCLSQGTPPFPAPIANANCGPQKPGSKPPKDGSNIADLNPCPLNACCNIWGQCGITVDFCIDTNTGPPGTAKPGTYGCISNCGVEVIKGTGDGSIKVAYFQGYGLSRKCLHQDALQIDTSKYTHLHFGFGTLTPTYEVKVGDTLSSYQFGEFKRITGAKRILSFGGWAFSTEADTYKIFRDGVKPANRLKLATNIANFIKANDLDGVDIDWEYPGAPDLPDFDPGKKEDGPNYLGFLAVLKNLLPGKTVAIAAPASYWYLKQFPIKDISQIVDYIVYMTYDLHGQWDAHSEYSQEGCDTGNCLRSQVNLTETRQALAMVTKAGVPGNKIVVGVTSYGRSFAMEQPGCWGPSCKFSGTRLESQATPGRCTGTAGYIADAEIVEIVSVGGSVERQSRVVTHFLDSSSNSDILVYDDNQWVSYMSENTKRIRSSLYAGWGMAGTTDWASDLQAFNEPPKPAKSWDEFKMLAAIGVNPKHDTETSFGNWKEFTCESPYIKNKFDYTPSKRWEALDVDNAWKEIVAKWENIDKANRRTFLESVDQSTHMKGAAGCQTVILARDQCHGPTECEKGLDGVDSGPAAQLIWDSLIYLHAMYHSYWDAVQNTAGQLALSIDSMEDTFAPIPEAKTNQWLNILIDMLTIGALTTAAPYFNALLRSLPANANRLRYENAKDTALTLIGQSTTLAKDMLQSPAPDKWTPQEQNKFSNYMGQVIFGWMNATEVSLRHLFDGTEKSIQLITEAIADGNLIEGLWDKDYDRPQDTSGTELQINVLKSVFGFSIPVLWRRSNTYAFVLDSGESCENGQPVGNYLSKYLEDRTALATGLCFEGTVYYLVHPEGNAVECTCESNLGTDCSLVCTYNKFSAPAGLDSLGEFGGVTKEDLVIGSVRTWRKNGRVNGGGIADPAKDDKLARDLLDLGIRSPGFVRLPVCSPDRAFQSWNTGSRGGSDNYPCDIPPGKDHCGESTFEDQTSGASPTVADCLQIIRNIEGDGSTEFTHSITGHREILRYGSCAFGIERTGGTGGAVQFMVGGQDVIDLINDSIQKYGASGNVGAKGVMTCEGTTVRTRVKVLWQIY